MSVCLRTAGSGFCNDIQGVPVYEEKILYIFIYFELIKKLLGITRSGKTSQVVFTFKHFSHMLKVKELEVLFSFVFLESSKLFLFLPSISFKVGLKGFINSQQHKNKKK